jgi:hypothetical protein
MGDGQEPAEPRDETRATTDWPEALARVYEEAARAAAAAHGAARAPDPTRAAPGAPPGHDAAASAEGEADDEPDYPGPSPQLADLQPIGEGVPDHGRRSSSWRWGMAGVALVLALFAAALVGAERWPDGRAYTAGRRQAGARVRISARCRGAFAAAAGARSSARDAARLDGAILECRDLHEFTRAARLYPAAMWTALGRLLRTRCGTAGRAIASSRVCTQARRR